MKLLLIVIVAVFSWYVIDLDFDSNDPLYSIERMIKWSPSSALTLLDDIQTAGNNPSLTNLDGLNADQIHEIAMERRTKLNEAQLDLIIRKNNGEFLTFDR